MIKQLCQLALAGYIRFFIELISLSILPLVIVLEFMRYFVKSRKDNLVSFRQSLWDAFEMAILFLTETVYGRHFFIDLLYETTDIFVNKTTEEFWSHDFFFQFVFKFLLKEPQYDDESEYDDDEEEEEPQFVNYCVTRQVDLYHRSL